MSNFVKKVPTPYLAYITFKGSNQLHQLWALPFNHNAMPTPEVLLQRFQGEWRRVPVMEYPTRWVKFKKWLRSKF